eukprot:194178-Rhodomonas_salina.2
MVCVGGSRLSRREESEISRRFAENTRQHKRKRGGGQKEMTPAKERGRNKRGTERGAEGGLRPGRREWGGRGQRRKNVREKGRKEDSQRGCGRE